MMTLELMSENDFMAFMRKSVPEYAYDQMKAGNWGANEAMTRARAEFQQMLPNGPATPNQHLRVMVMDGRKVGMVWYFVDTRHQFPKAFLIDFFVFPEERNKGYEAQAMAVFESEALALGVRRVELQIFTHREDEVHFYLGQAYRQVSVFLAKDLTPTEKG